MAISYATDNFTEQGGAKTVIGGKLMIAAGGEIEIAEGANAKGFPAAANQEASTATTVAGLKDDLNALITKLKDAGLMVADATT